MAMKKQVFQSFPWLLMVVAVVALASCTSDGGDDPAPNDNPYKYVLMTGDHTTNIPPGAMTLLDEYPNGTIDATPAGNRTLNGRGMGGWRIYNDQIFKMFLTADGSRTLERMKITGNSITSDTYIAVDQTVPAGSGNFVIQSETKGFYFDSAEPFKLQIFNPSTMERIGETPSYEEAITKTDAGITNTSIGRHFLAIKDGKLYANVNYSKGSANNSIGVFSDYFNTIYIGVIDLETYELEDVIEYEGTANIAYFVDNPMYDFDDNGDLYFLTQGLSATGVGSKILRIKAGQHDIDRTWEIDMDEINNGIGKFTTMFVKSGRIITTIPNTVLEAGPTGNINTGEIWEFHVFDVTQPASPQKIADLPLSRNTGASVGTVEVDGKILIRINNSSFNGYYELSDDWTSATPSFQVNGNAVTGFTKINVAQ